MAFNQEGEYEINVQVDDRRARQRLQRLEQTLDQMGAQDKKRAKRLADYQEGKAIKSARAEKRAYKKVSKDLDKELKKRMRSVKGNLDKRMQLHREHVKRKERLEKKHSKRMAAFGKGGRRGGGAGGGMAGGMGGLGDMIGKVTSKLGPLGLAIGAAIGGAAALFSSAAKAARELEAQVKRITTLLSNEQAKALPDAIEKLMQVSNATGVPMAQLTDSLYNVISAVPVLADNLTAAASVSEKAAKTAIALGASTDKVTLAATNLGNAAGANLANLADQDKIMDTLANTMKMGVIPSGEALAGSIAKAAPSIANLSENSYEALDAIGAMTAQITANGLSIDEAQTRMVALSNTLMDTNAVQRLMNAGMRGFDPETRKVTDWSELIQSLGENTNEAMDAMTNIRAKQAVLLLGKEGGESFAGLVESMQDAGGTAEEMYGKMADTAARQGERLTSSWTNFKAKMGEGTSGIIATLKGAAADALNWLTNLFKSSTEKMKEHFAEVDRLTGITDAAIGSLMQARQAIAAPTEVGVAQAIESVGSQLSTVQEMVPHLSAEFEELFKKGKDAPTIDTLKEMESILNQANETAKLLRMVEAQEGLDELSDSFEDILDKQADVGKGAGESEDAFDKQKKRLEEIGSQLDANVQAQEAAIKAGDPSKIKDLRDEYTDLRNEQRDVTLAVGAMTAATQEHAALALEGIKAANGGSLKGLDLEQAKAEVKSTLLGTETDINDLGDETNKQIDDAIDKLFEQEDILLSQEELVGARLEQEAYVEELLQQHGVTEAATNEEKIRGLQAIIGQIDGQLALMQVSINMGEAALKNDQLRAVAINMLIAAQNQLNEAQGAELRGQEVSLANLEAQLSATKAQHAALKGQREELTAQLKTLEAGQLRAQVAGAEGAPTAGGGRGGGRGREAEKAQRDQEKAAKEAQRAAEKAAKERLKAMQDELNSRAEEVKARYAAIEAERERTEKYAQLTRDLSQATEEFTSDIQKQVQEFKDANLGDLAGLLGRYTSSIQQSLFASEAVLREFMETRQSMADQQSDLNRELQLARNRIALEERRARELASQARDLRGLAGGGGRTQPGATGGGINWAQAEPRGGGGLSAEQTQRMETLQALRQATQAGQFSAETTRQFRELQINVNQSTAGLTASIDALIQELQDQQQAAPQAPAGGAAPAGQLDTSRIESDIASLERDIAAIEDPGGSLDQLRAERDAIEARMRALSSGTEQMLAEAEISDLLKTSTMLDGIVARRQEIADLEAEAAQATDFNEQMRLIAEASQARAQLAADLAETGVVEETLVENVRRHYRAVTEMDLTGLSDEYMAAIDNTNDLLEDQRVLQERNSDTADEVLTSERLHLKLRREGLDAQRAAGLLQLSDLAMARRKVALLDDEIPLLKDQIEKGIVPRVEGEDELLGLMAQRKDLQAEILDGQRKEFDALKESLNEWEKGVKETQKPIAAEREKHAKALAEIDDAIGVTEEERAKARKQEAERHYQRMVELMKELSEKVVGAIGDVAGVFEKVTDQIVQDGYAVLDAFSGEGLAMLETLGGGVADALGFGEVFDQALAAGRAIANGVANIILLNDEAYQANQQRIGAMKQLIEYETRALNLLEAQQAAMDILLTQYKARNDEAREQAEIDQDRMFDVRRSMSNMAEALGVDIGAGDFDAVMAAYEQAQRQQEDLRGQIEENNARLEDRLGPKSRKQREQWAEEMGLEMETYEMLLPLMEEYMGLIEQEDELRRQALRDDIAAIDHAKAVADLQRKISMAGGEIDETLYNEQQAEADIDYLEDKLQKLDELYEQAKADRADELISLDEFRSIELERLQVQADILDLKRAQNAEDAEGLELNNAKIGQLVRQRMELVLLSRSQRLTADQRQQIQDLERKIIEEMTAAGADPAAIAAALEAFQNSMPSYETGVAQTKEGPVYVHERERIHSKMSNEAMVASMQAMRRDLTYLMRHGWGQTGPPQTTRMPIVSGGDITLDAEFHITGADGQDPAAIADACWTRFEEKIPMMHDELHRRRTYNG